MQITLTSEKTHSNASVRRPRLAYLTTEYPHISHTFIRREVEALESLGYEIKRVAIQRGESHVEQADQAEALKTVCLLAGSRPRYVGKALRGVFFAGAKMISSLLEVYVLSRVSDRGLPRHIAYLVEALMFLTICREARVEHVHVHFGTNAATVAHLAHLMGGPQFSVMVHGPVEFDQPYGQSLGRKLSAAIFVAAISSYCRSQIMRWLPYEHWNKINIVPCTVGDEWFEAAKALGPDSKDLVCVGRLDEQKGQLLLLEAFAHAVGVGFTGRLILVGDGPFRGLLEERTTELGLRDSVVFAGWCTAQQIRCHMLDARALVLASFAEGLPVVIMEAMALQRPVLSTRITGIPELVRDGEEGFLFPPADQTELSDAMMRLERTHLADLREMGFKARQRVRERHYTNDAVQRLDQLFRACYDR